MPLLKTGNAFVQNLDPNDELDYTFKFKLKEGESIVSAFVTVIDPETCLPPVAGTDLVLENVSFGLLDDDQEIPDGWGVTVWVSEGTPSKSYYLQCQITTDSAPIARVITRTMRLLCADQ